MLLMLPLGGRMWDCGGLEEPKSSLGFCMGNAENGPSFLGSWL